MTEAEAARRLALRKEYIVERRGKQSRCLSLDAARQLQLNIGGVVKYRWVGDWMILAKTSAEERMKR